MGASGQEGTGEGARELEFGGVGVCRKTSSALQEGHADRRISVVASLSASQISGEGNSRARRGEYGESNAGGSVSSGWFRWSLLRLHALHSSSVYQLYTSSWPTSTSKDPFLYDTVIFIQQTEKKRRRCENKELSSPSMSYANLHTNRNPPAAYKKMKSANCPALQGYPQSVPQPGRANQSLGTIQTNEPRNAVILKLASLSPQGCGKRRLRFDA